MRLYVDFGGKTYHMLKQMKQGDRTACGIETGTINGLRVVGDSRPPWVVSERPDKRLCKNCAKVRGGDAQG